MSGHANVLRRLGMGMLCSALAAPLCAQEINFADLKRQGAPLVKRYVVSGVAADGREYVQKFDGVDTGRVQAYRAQAAAYASAQASAQASSNSSASNSSSSSRSSAPSLKTYECIIYCESASGPTITRQTEAANRSEAARFMNDNAERFCQNTGFRKSSSLSFPEKQCRER